MATCKDCHNCVFDLMCRNIGDWVGIRTPCSAYKDRSRFVELPHAEWVEDEYMYGDPIFRCSNCEARFVFEEGTPEDNDYCYCPTCGAKIQEQALKECESND